MTMVGALSGVERRAATVDTTRAEGTYDAGATSPAAMRAGLTEAA